MASGLGRRFGGNKLMADLCGAPMIDCILRATDGLFDRRIVVTRHEAVRDYCERFGAETILHDLPLRSDTIRIGLEALSAETESCMFCPADQPLISRQSLKRLLSAMADQPDCIHQLSWKDTPGMPACFPKWTFDALKHLPAGKGGSALMREHPDFVRRWEAQCGEELLDADTPEDLQAISEIMARRKLQ